MRNTRWLAPGAIVWLLGLGMGSLAGTLERSSAPPVEPAGSVRGYTMLAADFHVHSFPGDGTLLPWDIATEAHRRGLDVVALTNHNHMLEWAVATAARPWMRSDVILLPGEEVTSPGFHLAAVGVRGSVPWSRSPSDVIAAVHASGGVAIAAHPGKGYGEAYDTKALKALDGVEAAHAIGSDGRRRQEIAAFYARARAAHPAIAAIGSSDFHREAPIGVGRTYVFVTERTGAGVLEAVRAGRTAACDGSGGVAGEEPWTSFARASCGAAMQRLRLSPARNGGALNAFAVACALTGLAALVFVPRRA